MGTSVQGRTRTVLAVGSAIAAVAALAGCGGSSGASAPKATGPVTIEYWGQNAVVGTEADVWNKAHPDIQVHFTKTTLGDTGYQKIATAISAGTGPCLVETDAARVATWASQGLQVDVTKYAGKYQGDFTSAAWKAASPGGTTFAVPLGSSPNFYAYRTDLFAQYGLMVPKTWDDFIADGKKLKAANPNLFLMNYAPEDPSGFVGLSWEAGASWYTQAGDGWKINFKSDAALKAAAVLQQMVDNKLLSSVSYTDPAVWGTWDNGGTLSMTTSTWQLPIYAKVFPKSAGKWAIATVPQYAAGESSTDSSYSSASVAKGCKYPEQAVQFAAWLSTDPGALKAQADPVAGSSLFPSLKDVSAYTGTVIPTAMIPAADTNATVVSTAAGEVNTGWQYGPDYSTMYTKMAGYWPQVLSGKMPVVDLLSTMQDFVLSDLKSQGINASAG